jgi:4-amino-4-deoxy-L-arabinose transferase-like glycosyltransferase
MEPRKQKSWEILHLLICSFLLCLSWLLCSWVRKFRRDLWIILYTIYHHISYRIIISYQIISFYIIYHIIYDISYHIISYHISYHISYIISRHIVSYHIIYHIISYHIISYNTNFFFSILQNKKAFWFHLTRQDTNLTYGVPSTTWQRSDGLSVAPEDVYYNL